MHVCNVLLIIFDKNSSKMFARNSWSYGSSYIEDSINKAPLVSPVLFHYLRENQVMQNKNFHKAVQSSNAVFAWFNAKFAILETRGLI